MFFCLLLLPVIGIAQTGIIPGKISPFDSKIVLDSIAPDSSKMSSLNSYEFAKKFGRGWNVGNSLEAPGGETAYGNPLITQALIDSVKAAGFNAIRIPVAWSHFTDATNYIIDPAWLNRVEEVVNYVLKDSMYAVMNEHWDGGWIVPTAAQQVSVNNRLAIMWRQIALRFRDYNDHLIFAGTNEVMVAGDYNAPKQEYADAQNSYNQTFVKTVRSTGGRNVYRFLAVQGFNTNIDFTNTYFVMPKDTSQKRLIVEVHYYDPYDFTINTGNTNIIEWGSMALDPSKMEAWANESYADGQFQKMKAKFIANNHAVILGEYGAMGRLNLGSTLNATQAKYRQYYMKYITRSLVRRGIIPFYWDNGFTGNNGLGIFYRLNAVKAFPDIINAIIDTTNVKIPTNSAGIDLIKAGMLKIYPNPVKNLINLELSDLRANYCKLLDMYGQVIRNLIVDQGINTYDLSSLKPGLYFIQISTAKGVTTGKIEKE
jgi:endoglucanase